VRAAAFRNRYMSFAKICSIGLRPGRILTGRIALRQLSDEPTHGCALVAAVIVRDDDVTGSKRQGQGPFDIGSERSRHRLDSQEAKEPRSQGAKEPRSVNPVLVQRRQWPSSSVREGLWT
jgi:hypothetical protein